MADQTTPPRPISAPHLSAIAIVSLVLAVQKKEIASDDNKLKVTTSGFWVKRSDLNKEAALQAAYKSKEMYVMVISDAKSTVGNMTLDSIIKRHAIVCCKK